MRMWLSRCRSGEGRPCLLGTAITRKIEMVRRVCPQRDVAKTKTLERRHSEAERLHLHAFSNPNGIVSSSPGLRGTSYPGWQWGSRFNPERVAANVPCSGSWPAPQPFQGWLHLG